MSISITLDQIVYLAPNIQPNYREAFTNVQALLDQAEITQSALRVAHFMAQILHESGALTIQFESLNYSAERLPKVWPSRFKPQGPLDPNDYAHSPEKLANEVYGNRMGNTDPDDGYKYRGRGLLQLTGKESYEAATGFVKPLFPSCPNFETEPDTVICPPWCLVIATSEWVSKNCNAYADQDNIRLVTKAINGGLIGLAERTEWLKKTKAVWS